MSPKAARKPRAPKKPALDLSQGMVVEPEEGDVIISYSELSTYRDCPLKHFLAYNQRWTKAEREDLHPLTKGTLWHEVMDAHYTTFMEAGPDRNQHTLVEAERRVRALLFSDHGEQTDLQRLVWWMYRGYVEKYGTDPRWLILGVEVKFQQRLRDPRNGNPTPYLLKGKLDLVVQDLETYLIWIIDHKSGANLPNEMDLDVDDQFGLYAWLMRTAGLRVIGTIHNAARTTQNKGDLDENWDGDRPLVSGIKRQTLDQRMRRTFMNRTDEELEAIARDAWAVAVNAYPEAMGGRRLPMYSNPDPRSCGWKCDFLEPHLAARKGRHLADVLPEFGFVQDFTRH